MSERDTATQPLHDVLSAFGLLTRLPLPQTNRHRPDAAWCWPLVGLVIGGISTGLALGLTLVGVSAGVAAAALMGCNLMLTGAMHEDGLADAADGLFGGWTVERRLEIMKDSRIGSYGTLALITVALAVWSGCAALLAAGNGAAIIAAAALSRAPMAIVMSALPNARKSGLSSGFGRPAPLAAIVAGAISVAATFALVPAPSTAVAMILAAGVATVWVAWTAKRKIGGQTGDILGTAQQLSFLAALAMATM